MAVKPRFLKEDVDRLLDLLRSRLLAFLPAHYPMVDGIGTLHGDHRQRQHFRLLRCVVLSQQKPRLLL